MAWFKREKKLIEQPTPPEERRVRTEGLWVKCESCRAIVFRKDLEATLHVCPKCQFHFKMGARSRLEMLLDGDRKSTRLNSSHRTISYAVFCLKKKNVKTIIQVTSVFEQRMVYIVLW